MAYVVSFICNQTKTEQIHSHLQVFHTLILLPSTYFKYQLVLSSVICQCSYICSPFMYISFSLGPFFAPVSVSGCQNLAFPPWPISQSIRRSPVFRTFLDDGTCLETPALSPSSLWKPVPPGFTTLVSVKPWF